MAIIQSGAGSTLWTIDPTSNSGRVTVYNQNGTAMGSVSSLSNILNALNSATTIVLGGQSTLGINVVGTTGTLTLSFEGSIDNIDWFAIPANSLTGTGIISSTSSDGYWIASTSGLYAVRTRISSYTSGSMNVSINLTPGPSQNISQSVTGIITANIGTTNGLALDSTLTGGNQITKLTDGTNTASVKAASTAAGATDKALVVVISPNNSVAVTGTFFQATQPVSGTVAATQSGTWTVQPGNTANTTPWLTTISQGGNSAVVSATGAIKIDGSAVTQPVSGTITANAGTGSFTVAQSTAANLNATVVGSGNFTVVQPTASNLNANVSGTVTSNIGTTNGLALDATLTSGSSKTQMYDGANVIGTAAHPVKTDPTGTTTQPVSGTVTANAGTGNFTVAQATAANLNATVTGTVAATQSGTWTVQPGNTANTTPWLTTLNQGGNTATISAAGALKIDGSAVTQPVSGTVTANAGTGSFTVAQSTAANLNATVVGTVTANVGTTNGLALDATLTGGTQRNKITDGTTNASVKAASTAAVGTDTALVVAVSPNNSVAVTGTFFQGTQPVSGTVTANAGTGNFTVTQATAANLNATVTGTVTSNIGTTGGLALDVTLTGGTAKNRITDGTNTAAVKAASTAPLSTDPALVVAISPNSSVVVNSDGYATTAAPSYTNNTFQALSLTTLGALRTDSSATTQPVSGTVTSNAGTGTFAISAASLPLPTGAATETTLGTRLADATFTTRINTLGQKTMANSTPVVLASDQASIPVTGSGNFTVTQATASNLNATVTGTVASTQSGTWTVQPGNTPNTTPWLATINQGGNSATVSAGGALKIDGSAVTQPVSGTVTANAGTGSFTVVQATAANLNATITGTVTSNIGTTNGLALDATLTGGTQRSKITDGTNNAAVKAASTAAATTDPALVVAISPNNSVAVTGTFFQTTQPVSGTVTSNIGTTNGLALDATLAKLTIAQSTALGSNTQAMVAGSVTTAAPTYVTGNINPLSLTTAGALRIDGSGSIQPVSGTVTANAGTGNFTVAQATAANLNATVTGTVAATQSGTWTVQPGNTANTTPWLSTISQGGNSVTVSAGGALKIDGSAVTQPVSGTITANAGTGSFTVAQATAANLNATVVGTVTSNIGTTNGLALDTSVNGILVAQGSTTSGEKGTLIQGAVTTAAPTYTTAQTSPLSLTTAGALRTDASATTQPVSGTITANAGTGSFTVAQATAANLNATVVGSGNFTVVQPTAANLNATVSGTVTSNIGTTNGLALDATLTGGTAKSRITDGTNTAAVKAASTAAGATDPALVVAISPNNSVAVTGTFFQATQPVSGTFFQATQPVSGTVTANAGSGSFTVVQATAANLNATVVGTATDNTTNSTVKLPVMAALANTASPTWSNGNMVPLSVDTTGALRITGTISASNPSVTTTGSAPPASATYIAGSVTTAAPTYTTGQMSALSLTTSGAIRIDGSGTTQPVSGTVTANAGTGSFTVAQATAANLNATVVGSGNFTVVQATAANLNATVTGTVTANAGSGSFTVVQATAANLNATVTGTVTSNIGTTNGLALDSSIAKLTIAQSAALGTNTQALVGGSVTTAAPTYTTGNINPLSLTTAGALRVDASATTQPVSGTVTANAGTGSFTVAQATAANLNATVVGSGNFTVTQATASNLNATVAGTVTSNQGTANTNANGWFSRLTDGTNNVAVKAASTQAAAADVALVVSLNPLSAQTKSSTSAVTQVASSATSVTLLASNANRLGAIIVNDSTQILFVKFGSGSSSTSYSLPVAISKGSIEVPFGYTGIITGNWVSANGNAYVTELTV